MSIQEKLQSLKPYVQAMRFVEDFPIIDAKFKKDWRVPSGSTIKVITDDTANKSSTNSSYSFFSENKNIGFDELLEYVTEIINLNIDREKKQELYKVKNNELKALFLDKNNSYNDLVNLEFKINKNNESDETLEFNDDLLPEENNIKVEPLKIEPVKLEEVKMEEVKVEPVKIEPVKIEPVKPKRISKDSQLLAYGEDEPPLAVTDQPKYEL